MWHWERGRLPYFQFDRIRRMAVFAISHDWKQANFKDAEAAVGLKFDPQTSGYERPWRNYQRVLRTLLLVAEQDRIAKPTPVAQVLASEGQVTSDEYFHFWAQTFTEPSAAVNWDASAEHRFPMLFGLKYILAKASARPLARTSLHEIIGAFSKSGFKGTETWEEFCLLLDREAEFESVASTFDKDNLRNARESLLVLAQISYLEAYGGIVSTSIHREDAAELFAELSALNAPFLPDRNDEIRRRASLFADGSVLSALDFARTADNEVVSAGFTEGSKVQRTHLVIERNSKLRRRFLDIFKPQVCDICRLQTTKTYPWTQAVIDVHHKLPLASGTRTDENGTMLADLVAVCPSCHRAVHRYYENWLADRNQKDFRSIDEANTVYTELKADFPGATYD